MLIKSGHSAQLSNTMLSAMLDRLSSSGAPNGSTDIDADNDVNNAAFMADFKEELEKEAAAEGKSGKAHEMLAALKEGSLTITDPVNGMTIKAWDVDAVGMKDVKSMQGSAIRPSNWSDFLSKNLKRDFGLSFTKRDGNYVDKATDQSVAFAVTNGTKTYVSWTKPVVAPDPRPNVTSA
jgi:hypothetical protein